MASERSAVASTPWRRAASVVACALLIAACQSTTRVGDRYYENGRYPEAAAAFQAYLASNPSDNEEVARTLYRLGVILATPQSPAYDPERSLVLLERLITDYPGSPHAAEAQLLRALQIRANQLDEELQQDRIRLVELEVDLTERELELDSLRGRLREKEEQVTALQNSIPPLRIEIRTLIRELASKERKLEQLEQLKAIDLDQPPP